MSSTFGRYFRATTFGESHGGCVGVVVDGCPAGHKIDLNLVQDFLARRRPGQSKLASPRSEQDLVECVSGLDQGLSLGSPMTLMVRNKDAKPEHYEDIRKVYRPSQADYTTETKYGIRAMSGGGRASARETIGRVAAAAVAEQFLAALLPTLRIYAYVDSVKGIEASIDDPFILTREKIDEHPLRCPDTGSRCAMTDLILQAKENGDSVGGTISCIILNPPAGLGEPIFDKLEADLAKAMMSLPAARGFEIGSGFASTKLYGSEHNDQFFKDGSKIRTKTNHSGGVQAGISNGEAIYLKVAFKPVSTIFKDQNTVATNGEEVLFKPSSGRHDPCVLPRAVPMVEAMAILTIMDHYMRHLALVQSNFKN